MYTFDDVNSREAFELNIQCLREVHRRNKRSFNIKNLAGALLGIVIFIVVLGIATFAYIKRKKLTKQGMLKIFQWTYKREKEDGILEDGLEVAVKRPSQTSEQGEEQFKNEVILMAKLQHRSLVKLLGCSIHQDEKLLIYEFMANRSLDYFIFDSTRKKQLDMTKRFQIINGIARGLLYLHHDSRLRIIHRDLKTSNILLDSDMNPRISDFGLARTFKGDQTEANTHRVIRTYGYMSPEYAVHGSFSIKSDVFSFGVLVLEIVSGRKNLLQQVVEIIHKMKLMRHCYRRDRVVPLR